MTLLPKLQPKSPPTFTRVRRQQAGQGEPSPPAIQRWVRQQRSRKLSARRKNMQFFSSDTQAWPRMRAESLGNVSPAEHRFLWAKRWRRSWKTDGLHRLPLVALLCLFLWLGTVWHWDRSLLAAVTLLIALLSGLFVWLLGVIALVPIVGPLIVKVLSLSIIWLLNAVGYLLSYIAIRRGYSRDVLTYRGLTIALIIGIILGYGLAKGLDSVAWLAHV